MDKEKGPRMGAWLDDAELDASLAEIFKTTPERIRQVRSDVRRKKILDAIRPGLLEGFPGLPQKRKCKGKKP